MRPVLYSDINKTYQLFVAGDLDYMYKNHLKNKTIMNYTPLVDPLDSEYINNSQYISHNSNSTNFKPNNYKENNC